MTKPEQCVGLTTHKWTNSCPHKILPVKYLSSFDNCFRTWLAANQQPLPYQRQPFQYRQKPCTLFFHLYQNVNILCISLDFVMAFLLKKNQLRFWCKSELCKGLLKTLLLWQCLWTRWLMVCVCTTITEDLTVVLLLYRLLPRRCDCFASQSLLDDLCPPHSPWMTDKFHA